MNGVHDLGGMDGFGPVEVEPNEPVFHEPWERSVFGIAAAVFAQGIAGGDAYRYAIERMDPLHYLDSSYYEHWLTALTTLLVEGGVITRDALATRVPGAFPLARPLPALRLPEPQPSGGAPRFAVGDRVAVRNLQPLGHTRCPRYVRGKRGVIVRVDGAFALPDIAAHADGAPRQHTYSVRFEGFELWGADAGSAEAMHVDLWESYLEAP